MKNILKAFRKSIKHRKYQAVINRVCENDTATTLQNYYSIVKITDRMFSTMDSQTIRRILRNVDNLDLSTAIKGFSGRSKHNIFNNLPTQIAALVAEDTEYMKNLTSKTIVDSVKKIFLVIARLINAEIITSADDPAVKDLANMIHEAHNDISLVDNAKMREIMDEYLKKAQDSAE